MCSLKTPRTKKATLQGGRGHRRRFIRYHTGNGSSSPFSAAARKVPRRSSNRFEARRRAVIAGLLAASNPAERRAIRRGCKAGRILRQEAEAMQQ